MKLTLKNQMHLQLKRDQNDDQLSIKKARFHNKLAKINYDPRDEHDRIKMIFN